MAYISPAKAFAHLDRLAGWQRGEKPAPVTVEWDLSNRCYLGCQACHFAHTHVKGPWAARKERRLPMAWEGTGDLANPVLVVNALTAMAVAGVKGVVWSGGGEPTLHPHWVEIVQQARILGFQQGMYTAGGLLTADTAAVLAECASWVVVSLDCVDAETYCREKGVKPEWFDKACEGISHLASQRSTVTGVSFLLHQGNWVRAEDMLALGRALGATYVTFRPTIETMPDRPAHRSGEAHWVSGALPLLTRLSTHADVECDPSRFVAYRDWQGRSYETCHGIKLNATVSPDGRVWLCPQRRGMAGSCIGDLSTESFADIWARHPGTWTDFADCRVMCRLHQMNQQLEPLFAPYVHEAFV